MGVLSSEDGAGGGLVATRDRKLVGNDAAAAVAGSNSRHRFLRRDGAPIR